MTKTQGYISGVNNLPWLFVPEHFVLSVLGRQHSGQLLFK